MIIGRIAVGIIIFVMVLGTYLFDEEDAGPAISVLITILMSSLFTAMALYILIQRGWI